MILSRCQFCHLVFSCLIGGILVGGHIQHRNQPATAFYTDADGDNIWDTDDSEEMPDFLKQQGTADSAGSSDNEEEYETGLEPHIPDVLGQKEFLVAMYSREFGPWMVANLHRLFIDDYYFDDGLADRSARAERLQREVDDVPYGRRVVFKHRTKTGVVEFSVVLADNHRVAVYVSKRDGVPTNEYVTTLPLPPIRVDGESCVLEYCQTDGKYPPVKGGKQTLPYRRARRIVKIEEQIVDFIILIVTGLLVVILVYFSYRLLQIDFSS